MTHSPRLRFVSCDAADVEPNSDAPSSGFAGVAVVVAGILGITQLGGNPHRAAVPATPKGFATYSSGMKLVKGGAGRVTA